jgi:hypothetical protein
MLTSDVGHFNVSVWMIMVTLSSSAGVSVKGPALCEKLLKYLE